MSSWLVMYWDATWQGALGADHFLSRVLLLSAEKWLEITEEPEGRTSSLLYLPDLGIRDVNKAARSIIM